MKTGSRILVVDDDQDFVQAMAALLEHDGHAVLTALNGREGVLRARQELPDLILLDVMMPELNGFDVCRIIKSEAQFEDIPILFLTALDSLDGEAMGLELGGIDYLTKPVNLPLLRMRIRNHLELKRRADLVKEQRDLLAQRNRDLEVALARIKRLEGILTICMRCKKIRNDAEVWESLEKYLTEHTDAFFSHGYCPDCVKEVEAQFDR